MKRLEDPERDPASEARDDHANRYAPPYLEATYTDGSPVIKGDRIRYRQQPGGILPASMEWKKGVASKCPWDKSGTLYLKRTEPSGREAYYHIFSHIVEKLP
jgi:hypothetical protein